MKVVRWYKKKHRWEDVTLPNDDEQTPNYCEEVVLHFPFQFTRQKRELNLKRKPHFVKLYFSNSINAGVGIAAFQDTFSGWDWAGFAGVCEGRLFALLDCSLILLQFHCVGIEVIILCPAECGWGKKDSDERKNDKERESFLHVSDCCLFSCDCQVKLFAATFYTADLFAVLNGLNVDANNFTSSVNLILV